MVSLILADLPSDLFWSLKKPDLDIGLCSFGRRRAAVFQLENCNNKKGI